MNTARQPQILRRAAPQDDDDRGGLLRPAGPEAFALCCCVARGQDQGDVRPFQRLHPLAVASLASGTCFLPAQGLFEGALRVSNKFPVTNRVDEDARAFARISAQLGQHIEIASMRAQEDVAGQGMQSGEGVLKVLTDAGVAYGVMRGGDETIFRPESNATHDDDVALSCRAIAGDRRAHGPGGAAAGVAGGFVGGEGDAAESDRVAVVEDAIDMHRGVAKDIAGRSEEVGSGAGLDNADVAIHDHVFGMGFTNNFGGAAHVIEVGLAVEQNPCVFPVEAELLDTGANLRGRRSDAGVDEDVAFGRHHKVDGEILAAHVVEVVGDLEGGDGRCPARGRGRAGEGGKEEEKEQQAQAAHAHVLLYCRAASGMDG